MCVSRSLSDSDRAEWQRGKTNLRTPLDLVALHLVEQGGDAARAGVAGACLSDAGQFDHQIGTEGREAAALLRSEGLPAILQHMGGIGAEHGAIGQEEASAAGKDPQGGLDALQGQAQLDEQAAVAAAGLSSSLERWIEGASPARRSSSVGVSEKSLVQRCSAAISSMAIAAPAFRSTSWTVG